MYLTSILKQAHFKSTLFISNGYRDYSYNIVEYFSLIFTSEKDRGSIPCRDRPKSLRQVVTGLLPNAWQQVWMSWVLDYDHNKNSRCGTSDILDCSMAMSAEFMLKFAAFHR